MNIIIYYAIFVLAILTLFIKRFKQNYSTIWNGVLFCILVPSILFLYSALILPLNNNILNISIIILALPFIILVTFGIYIIIFFFLFSARKLFKNENRSLANSLVLIAAIALIIYLLFSLKVVQDNMPTVLQIAGVGLSSVMFFYLLHIVSFISSSLIAYHVKPSLDQDYIIVLGSGLIDGQVPPLLAKRINKAIDFYHKQKNKPLKLVFSGGQGFDEPRPEAIAMQEYAINKGIPIEHTLVEILSKNTQENMIFSKKIIEDDFKDKSYKCIFSTSDFHVFRAAIYARRAGLTIYGIGAKTIWYYFINALLREYIAFFWLYKTKHLIIVILIFIITIIPSIIYQFVK